MDKKELEAAVEAILFTMGNAVEVERVAKAIGMSTEATRKMLRTMKEKYETEGRGIRLIELEDSFQMCTNPELYEYLIKIAKQPKKIVLTDVVLETLSIIAYKQPITRIELEKIRGVKCDHAVNKLIEFNLVKEVGRLDAPGRPLLFGTTEEFLRRFGVSSIDDLPEVNPVKMEDFKAEAEEEIEMTLKV